MRHALRSGVIDDGAVGLASHSDVELVVDAGFSSVPGPDGKVDVTKLVRPRRPADEPSANRLTVGIRAIAAIVDELISSDSSPMSI